MSAEMISLKATSSSTTKPASTQSIKRKTKEFEKLFLRIYKMYLPRKKKQYRETAEQQQPPPITRQKL